MDIDTYGEGIHHTRFLFIHSADQIPSDRINQQRFTVQLNQTFDRSAQGFQLSLRSISFLNTADIITAFNQNLFFIEAAGATPGVELTAQIPIGVYDSTDFPGVVETAMNAASGYGTGYTVTYDVNTTKLTVATVGGDDFRFVEVGTGSLGSYTPWHIMGVGEDQFVDTDSLEGEGILDLSGTKFVDIVSNLPTFNSSSGIQTPFERVPLNVGHGTYFQFLNPDTDFTLVEDNGVNFIQFELFDDRGHPFELKVNSFVNLVLKLRVQA